MNPNKQPNNFAERLVKHNEGRQTNYPCGCKKMEYFVENEIPYMFCSCCILDSRPLNWILV